jgi:hypothetical protein
MPGHPRGKGKLYLLRVYLESFQNDMGISCHLHQNTKMSIDLKKIFFLTSAALLAVTSAAKLVSATGNARVLSTAEPLSGMLFKHVFIFAAFCELAVIISLFSIRTVKIKALTLAWLSSCLLAYRFCLFVSGYHKACGCLGDFADKLHLPSFIADDFLLASLFYMLGGSLIIIFRPVTKTNSLPT